MENFKRWLRAIGIALIIFLFLSLYLFLRRGYYTIYIVNKVFASSAVILAGITLFIGPLRRIPFVASLMTIRRQLGLIAFVFAFLHIALSLGQGNRFPLFGWYLKELVPVTFGVIAIVLWIYMTYISRNTKIQQLGVDVWKKRLSLFGKVSFLAIFLHVTIMKYPGWVKWLNGEVEKTPELSHPSYPPASLFVFLFMSFVILYRVFVYLREKSR